MSNYDLPPINITSRDGYLEGAFVYRNGAYNLKALSLAPHRTIFNAVKASEGDHAALGAYLDSIAAVLLRRLDELAAKVLSEPKGANADGALCGPTDELPQNSVSPGQPYRVKTAVYEEIQRKIGRHKPELGGMLGGSRKDRTVTHFHFDTGAGTSSVTYSPDAKTLNAVLRRWNDEGIDLIGMVHSHPGNLVSPSGGDEIYAEKFLDVCKEMDAFFMPIIRTETSGKFEMRGYVYMRHPGRNRLAPVDYHVV